ncbi:keratin, type I cytoskeletal 18-like isoform X1 [Micropterus dolomieu]|uniref:keratin, type I cytoskeletal 18-like isoform X1 n=1 Tax=Micropterus dolomieu TaxID=147949 RepID=UPI001E8CEA68|nr:keratin, type I cytoskeletal 18-like isoform X1 [Micropterus dolomieu]
MPSNTAASMFGGAGGRGSRASVSSLEGLRSVLGNEPKRDSAPAAPAASVAPATPAAPTAPAAPADDKQTLRGLNDRLSGYLDTVRQLEKANEDLEKQIDDILAKRTAPEGRDWDKVEKPLDDRKNKIKDITMENAKLMIQINNTNMATDDFKNKLDDEKKACKELEKDLEDVNKTAEATKLKSEQTKKEIDLVNEELARLQQEHKDEVDDLREKIKDSEVKVEIDSPNSNLAQTLNKIRIQYDQIGKKNMEETEDWYQSKFENIKVVEAKNSEALNSGKKELKDLLKQKQTLDIKIQSLHSTIRNLEETLKNTKAEYGQRMGPINKVILNLEAELKEMRSQVERHVNTNKNLLCVTMKLESEINNYQQLINGMSADSLEISLEDALDSDQQKPGDKVPKPGTEEVKEEAPVKQESPSNKSTP